MRTSILLLLATDRDLSTHGGHEAAGDEQAEAGPARADAGLGVRAPVELAEDLLLVGERNAEPLVLDDELDGVALALGSDAHGAAGGRVAHRVVEQDREDLQQLLGVGLRRDRLLREVDDERSPVRRPDLHALHGLADHLAHVGRRDAHLEVAGVEPRDVEQRIDDLRQSLRLRRDVAEERRPLLLAEEDVLAEQRLREAVDRGQRRAQLVRHRGNEVGLHLLDEAIRRDVPEREDATCDGADRIAHDRFAHREPHLLATAHDRHEAVGGRRLGVRLELPLQHLDRGTAECVHRRDAGDLLRGCIPEDDRAVAVDRDDPVGDVGEDRDASFALERDALVELRVRQRGGRARGEREQRVDLLLAPDARARVVEGEHAARRTLGAGERHAEIRRVPGGEHRIELAQPRIGSGVLQRDGARDCTTSPRATRSQSCSSRRPPRSRGRSPR